MSPEEFVTALTLSLADPTVREALSGCFTASMKEELNPVTSSLFTLRAEIQEDFQKEIKSLKEEVTSLTTQLTRKETVIGQLEARITDLEAAMDETEQYSRRNSIRITGIPETKGENPTAKALDLFNTKMALTPPVDIADIDRAHRVGANEEGKKRGVLVKFTSYRARAKVFSAKKELKQTDIFINEDLTRKRSQLLFEARKAKRNGCLNNCWSSDGRVLIKTIHDVNVPIKSLNELRAHAALAPPNHPPEPPNAENHIAAPN